jgi:hypothetical protein
MRTSYAWIALFVLNAAAGSALAQTCSAPIEITNIGTNTGTSCANSNTLPNLANGAIVTSGNQAVYHIAPGAANQYGITVTLTPDSGVDLGLFICRGPCSSYSTCIAAVDSGAGMTSSAQIPAGAGDYFIIVGALGESTALTCGNYSLITSAPL